ncbi:hypothetical protein QTP88_000850 [Uroleucon formosanum]
MNNIRTKFVHKYSNNSFLFDNIMLSDSQIAESLDEILQDIDSDDDFLDDINFDDAVEPELQDLESKCPSDVPQFVPTARKKKIKPGVNKTEFGLSDQSSILDFFEAFVTPSLFGKVAFETNRYCQQFENVTSGSRINQWVHVDCEEMFVFLAITMLMARNKKLEIQDYWSMDPLSHQPIFGKYMSRNRYQIILQMLHFSQNEDQVPGDRLAKVRMPLKEITKNFKEAMVPFENLAIDESLVLWKGRLSFKQFIKTKRHRFGIKIFVLCDVETDFILDIIIYTGSTTEYKKLTLVLEFLMLLGHKLFIDNWYSSPSLAKYLHKKKTNVTGTIRKNRKGMPSLLAKLNVGQTESQHTKNMLVVKWKDRRDVFMLTTQFEDKMVHVGKNDHQGNAILKPVAVMHYNESMGPIDKTDMLLSSVECVRRTIKWYKKLFFHLIDLSLLNAYSAYKTCTGLKISLADFQFQLIREIFTKYATQKKNLCRHSNTCLPERLQERHFPSMV